MMPQAKDSLFSQRLIIFIDLNAILFIHLVFLMKTIEYLSDTIDFIVLEWNSIFAFVPFWNSTKNYYIIDQ